MQIVALHTTAPTEAPMNISLVVASSHSLMLEWERPSQENENGSTYMLSCDCHGNPDTLYG